MQPQSLTKTTYNIERTLNSLTTGQREGYKGAHFAAPVLGAVNTLSKVLLLFEMFTPIWDEVLQSPTFS